MNLTGDKKSFFSNTFHIAEVFFHIFVVMLAVYILVTTIVMPSEKEKEDNFCEVLDVEWQRVLDNGKKLPVEVPGKVEAARGEVVTLTAVLPENIKNDQSLCFHTIWQDVEIYIDGELRKSYNTEKTRLFGKNSPMRYLFVQLTEEDAGKELTYQFSSDSKYAGRMYKVQIGDRSGIWFSLVKDAGFKTIIALCLIVIGLFSIITCIVLRCIYKKKLSLIYLVLTIFFCASWMLSESDFRQIFVPNVSSLSNLTYWSLMMIPFPLLLYINDAQKRHYEKIYTFIMVWSVVTLIVTTVLQVFDIQQFVTMVPFIHFGLIATILCLVTTITIDVFTKRIKSYLFVGIGVYGMLFTGVVELFLYYMGATTSLGAVLGLGLLFLFVMAIIRTGQDWVHSENKKQQAILAREAQAKFLANMSHEIRTPINVIIGMNEMILRENNNTAIEEYAYNIQDASRMLLGLINDVLDFSKIESGRMEIVEGTYELDALIQDSMLMMKTRVGEKPISIKREVDLTLPSKLRGDELRVKQVLANILSNAVKYTNEGSVTLKVSHKEMDRETVVLVFAVTDTGIGIRKENIATIFDSFKRLDLDKNRTIQGTGLGLNIAKQLAEQMGGSIEVESEYGKGSTFTVIIPQKVEDWQPIKEWEEALSQNRAKKKAKGALFTAPDASVLIVDDNMVNLKLMQGLLKRTLVMTELASGGKECLEMTKNKHYDLIFMDHMMPELDGVETLHMLRAEDTNPNQQGIVIALSANAVAGCREEYLGYGFNDYLSKPIQPDKLELMMAQYLPKELVHMTEDKG